VDELFQKYVTTDEAAFADELYVSMNELKEMREQGMHVGGHGASHAWMNRLSPSQQQEEVKQTLSFLNELGVNTEAQRWTFCYPYGGYDDSLREILAQSGCGLALTTEVALAEVHQTKAFTMPRLDTNDLPTTAAAAPNKWTLSAQKGIRKK
jgi:peptidoglycan/xylan/chitin deacetylase (PgdA/CDA1 family)